MQNNSVQNADVGLRAVNRKVKVAFFSDMLIRDFDGANKTMYQLIDRIPERQFEYLFFCGMSKQHKNRATVKIPVFSIPNNHSYKIALPDLCKTELMESLDLFSPDVIHISTPSALGFFALNYALKKEIPVLSIYHTHFISYIKYYFKYLPFLVPLLEAMIAKIYRRFYNRCTVTYVPTVSIAEELMSHGVSVQHLRIWQRGINTTLFTPLKRCDHLIKTLTGNDNPCILFASRLVWEKNLETLFAIYDRVQEEDLKVNFIVAGSGAAEAAARARMKHAIFLGFVNHDMLAKVYASSAIFLFPSTSETYGNVVVEAMASGCIPVIARGGGSQALVVDGVNGFLCNPNEPDDYLIKMKRLLRDETLRAKMQSAGLQYTSNLSWDNLAREYFTDIENLANLALSVHEKKCI